MQNFKESVRKLIKPLGIIIVVIAFPFVLYSLWLIIGSSLYALKTGPNSGSGLGQMFGLVGLIFSAGILLVGYFLFKGDI